MGRGILPHRDVLVPMIKAYGLWGEFKGRESELVLECGGNRVKAWTAAAREFWGRIRDMREGLGQSCDLADLAREYGPTRYDGELVSRQLRELDVERAKFEEWRVGEEARIAKLSEEAAAAWAEAARVSDELAESASGGGVGGDDDDRWHALHLRVLARFGDGGSKEPPLIETLNWVGDRLLAEVGSIDPDSVPSPKAIPMLQAAREDRWKFFGLFSQNYKTAEQRKTVDVDDESAVRADTIATDDLISGIEAKL